MVDGKGPLKHVVLYDTYAIYTMAGGLYLAETRYEQDEMQIWSCDLRELLEAIDQIEDLASGVGKTPPWFERYVIGLDEMVILPSAAKPMVPARARPVRKDPYVHPYDIESDLKEGRIYRSMPSRIAREFGMFKVTAVKYA